MSRNNVLFTLIIILLFVATCPLSRAADWPMWRHDAGRTGKSSQPVLVTPYLQWTRQLPPLTPAYRNPRLQFDAGYEPVVAGKTLVVGSSRNDSVTAYSTETGDELWRFYSEGPVRFAPVLWQGRVIFGSDDGHLYCLALDDGELLWKFQAVPRSRKILGNRRLISVWPIRGGPVVADGHVYFAAGVWPFEGVFIYALDAATGKKVWLNDRLGFVYGDHPHNAEAFGGMTPQGYLVVNGDELIVPCSAAYPAKLSRRTGETIEFTLPRQSRLPGGYFAALDPKDKRDLRRGDVTLDQLVNRQQHEDDWRTGAPDKGLSRRITLADTIVSFDDKFSDLTAPIHCIIAAGGKTFVVTRDGALLCYGARPLSAPKVHAVPRSPVSRLTDSSLNTALVEAAGALDGFALIYGLADGELVENLIQKTRLHIIGVDRDGATIAKLRRRFDYGDYGTRIALLTGSPKDIEIPPFLASLITSETPERFVDSDSIRDAAKLLRPFGGSLCFQTDNTAHQRISEVANEFSEGPFSVERAGQITVVRRSRGLPGATNYAGGWQPSQDVWVRAPLGVLWFDDGLGHFKRSPQPKFIDGLMISYPKDWHAQRKKGDYSTDYPLLDAELSDVYTGRVLGQHEAVSVRKQLEKADPNGREPSQYRPPTQRDAWKPDPPSPGQRINPLTGETEPRTFPKSYGCDGGLDYGKIFTMRSGTPAFYDKTLESGTICISGPRSGCTNSVIPANGLLNVPYFYEGCTCSYPLPVGLAMVAMPETHEQWACWGPGQPRQIQRVGINFGAPGDRMTREGTLWLDFPSVGGPSPELTATALPRATEYHYRHSLWIEQGTGWPWVVSSGVQGLSSFVLRDLKPGRYLVRLFFADLEGAVAGMRIQSINVQGKTVLRDFDISAGSGGGLRGVVPEFSGVVVGDNGAFELNLAAKRGKTLISGLELVRQGSGR
ncbi:MAG: PQQ-binding-like beta-propeller repeat protein [Pirellulaceae bacterium]|jgi:hypothetical protein|nr:PQQ-binding-like beta-propeller repeat protein [Pirellulaceae bacterium]